MKNLVKEILKDKGYKATPARMAILQIFIKNKLPLNAEAIYQKILKIKKAKNINEATIYRTLASLEQSGVLKKVDLRKDSIYFELAKEHHHHIVCTNCDRVEDFKNQKIENLLGLIVENSPQFKNKFKNIKEHSLELFGLCNSCYR